VAFVLKDNGVEPQEFVGKYSAELTKEIGFSNHEVSALSFFLKVIEWMQENY